MVKSASSLGTFFKELRRRKIFQVAVVYAIVGWLLIQVAETIFPRLHLPDWSVTLVIVLVIIGFPIALIVAWALELTPEGVKRTEAAEEELQEGKRKTGLRLEYVLIVLLVIAVVYLFYRIEGKRPEAEIPPVSTINSIAVLPFVNMSADKEQEYFCDGLAEELLNMLAKVKGLRVTARTSSFSFKGKDVDIATIGEKLNVESVLEGSVRKADNQVRITTQLIKVPDGYHLWSETYDRNLDDIFAVQEEISRQVVGALEVTLLGEDESELAGRPTGNIEAYELYLLGLHHFNEGGVGSREKAIGYFTRATELDPDYAVAYAYLAFTYINQYRFANLPKDVALSKAEEAAMKALSIDDQLAEAHAALGYVRDWQFDFPGAEAEIKKAIELNPNFMGAYSVYSHVLSVLGRYKDAETILEQALEIDPLSEWITWGLNFNLLMLGRFEESTNRGQEANRWYGHLDEALRKQKKRVEKNPGSSESHAWLASIYTGLGEYELAEKSLARARELAPEKIVISEYQEDYLYLARGQYTQYLQFTYDMLRKEPGGGRFLSRAAFAEMMVGNYQKALTLYERARSADTQVDLPFGLSPWFIAAYGTADLVYMANAYFKTGDPEMGKKLLTKSRAFLGKLREQGLGTPDSYYFEASIHALWGDKQEALASLRKAIDLGWRRHWYAKLDPTMELLRDTPEFKEMMAEVEADIARQRERLKQEGLLE